MLASAIPRGRLFESFRRKSDLWLSEGFLLAVMNRCRKSLDKLFPISFERRIRINTFQNSSTTCKCMQETLRHLSMLKSSLCSRRGKIPTFGILQRGDEVEQIEWSLLYKTAYLLFRGDQVYRNGRARERREMSRFSHVHE
jgi:hypothetical protein